MFGRIWPSSLTFLLLITYWVLLVLSPHTFQIHLLSAPIAQALSHILIFSLLKHFNSLLDDLPASAFTLLQSSPRFVRVTFHKVYHTELHADFQRHEHFLRLCFCIHLPSIACPTLPSFYFLSNICLSLRALSLPWMPVIYLCWISPVPLSLHWQKNWMNSSSLPHEAGCQTRSCKLTLQNPPGTSLVVQWLRICLPMQGMWVWSLVEELISHMPRGN